MVIEEQPSGTVTMVFTDIEGSTRLLRKLGTDAYREALAEHRRTVRAASARHGGYEVDYEGDAFFIAFRTALAAVVAVEEVTQELERGPIRLRIGIHTGEPVLDRPKYVGLDVHVAARVMAVAHGGQTLLSAATADLVRDHVELRDLGEHRLKDLDEPQRLYQLGVAGFPPLKTIHQTNLPARAAPLIGREPEIRDVLRLLRRDDISLVTLTGAGGTGKSRLAIEAAERAGADYPDGVWFVPLAALRDPTLVLESIAQSLGLRAGGDAMDAILREHLASRQLLLVLDNLEQLLPDVAPPIAELLATAPGVDLLVSSREPLCISAEHEYPVPPLRPPDAIALFVERAKAVHVEVELELDGRMSAIEAICERLDRLPLAIELAAPRLKGLTPEKLFERLEKRLPLLTRGARDAPERQRTLRATIAWSHNLLAPEEKRLFARLAVFAGGCTLEAAEAICEADVDTLESLITKSLLRHRNGRYSMLQTVREFADEQLTLAEERDAVSSSHTEYFLSLAEEADSHFDTSNDAAWIDLLTRDHDNLRAALASSADSPLQLRLACALWRFWIRRGHHAEGRRWLNEALRAAGDAATVDVARGLRAAASFAWRHGDFDYAEEFAAQSGSVARRLGERTHEGIALGALSEIAQVRGDYQRAAELMTRAETLFSEVGDENRIAIVGSNRTNLAIQMGDFDLALKVGEQVMARSRELENWTNVVSAALNVALAANSVGNRRVAACALTEAIEVARSLGHRVFLAEALVIAAAIVLGDDPNTGTFLIAAVERALHDLQIALDPLERDLLRSIEIRLSVSLGETEAIKRGNLDELLEAAADRALQSLGLHTSSAGTLAQVVDVTDATASSH